MLIVDRVDTVSWNTVPYREMAESLCWHLSSAFTDHSFSVQAGIFWMVENDIGPMDPMVMSH